MINRFLINNVRRTVFSKMINRKNIDWYRSDNKVKWCFLQVVQWWQKVLQNFVIKLTSTYFMYIVSFYIPSNEQYTIIFCIRKSQNKIASAAKVLWHMVYGSNVNFYNNTSNTIEKSVQSYPYCISFGFWSNMQERHFLKSKFSSEFPCFIGKHDRSYRQ